MGKFILSIIILVVSIPLWFIFPIPFVAPIGTIWLLYKVWSK